MTAAEYANNQILFCLDSDNILERASVPKLKEYMINSGACVASFQELHYFSENVKKVTHRWVFKAGQTTFADYLSGLIVPGASGNYMFTKNSWIRAKGYPEYAGALDAWGFGLRQVATDQKMMVMPNSFYYHRYGHDSYWVRESKKGKTSLIALQLLIPFLDKIHKKDVDYIMSRKGRYCWFENLDNRSIRMRSGTRGKSGYLVKDNIPQDHNSASQSYLKRITKKLLSRCHRDNIRSFS